MTAMHDEISQGFRPALFFPRLFTLAKGFACEWWCRRQIAKSVGALSSQTLQDISLTPDDVQTLESLPLTKDAAQSLAETANSRSGNW